MMQSTSSRKRVAVKQEKAQDLAPWAAPSTNVEGGGKPGDGVPWAKPKQEESDKGGLRPAKRWLRSLPTVDKGFLDDEDIPKEEKEAIRKAVLSVRKARAVFLRASNALAGKEADHVSGPWPLRESELGQEIPHHTVSMRSYSAVGFGDTASDDTVTPEQRFFSPQKQYLPVYGLIDRGPGPVGSGTRCVIMHSHAARRNDDQQSATDRVRPGAILRAVSVDEGGGSARLRVRFTTPERYYAPGERVTTIRIGVDAVDWDSLTPKQPRLI
jgi:hypothetical protein